MTKLEDERTTATNTGLAIWRVQCIYKAFVQGSTLVILLNICAKFPPHRQVGPQQNPCKYQYLQGFLIKCLSKKLSKTECSTFFILIFFGDFGVFLD